MTPTSEIGRTWFSRNTGANIKPGINHFCLTVENSNVDLTILADHGVTKSDAAGGGLRGPLFNWQVFVHTLGRDELPIDRAHAAFLLEFIVKEGYDFSGYGF